MGIQDNLDRMSEPPATEKVEIVNLEIGDTIVARVTGYHVARTRHGPTPICHLRREGDDEDIGVWVSTSVIRTCFDDERPVPGDMIGIKRFEDHKDPKYQQFHLEVERGNVPFEGSLPQFLKDDPKAVPGGPTVPQGGAPPDQQGAPPADDIPPPSDDDIPF